ncbi:MAG: radical SAM protein [Planctomycetes bacterium]|nr:radical SAM protein [Planctomycetota bacterium]
MLKVRSIIFEAVSGCNWRCGFCYNVWHADSGYRVGQLSTRQTKRILSRAIGESGCELVSFSGGEPLMRKDIVELISFVRSLGVRVNLLTNGSLLTAHGIRELTDAGVSMFQLPLHSSDREVFRELTGADSFDAITEAFVDIGLLGGQAAAVVVVTKRNLHTLAETLQMACALGARGVLLNRMNLGGRGLRHAAELFLSPAEVTEMLETADEAAEKWGLPIACPIPMPRCVVDTTRFRHLSFTDCAAGTDRNYVTLDALGNVRLCNHTPEVLGNLQRQSLRGVLSNPRARLFCEAVPHRCVGCAHVKECRGGCKAAVLVAYGTLSKADPLVEEQSGPFSASDEDAFPSACDGRPGNGQAQAPLRTS